MSGQERTSELRIPPRTVFVQLAAGINRSGFSNRAAYGEGTFDLKAPTGSPVRCGGSHAVEL